MKLNESHLKVTFDINTVAENMHVELLYSMRLQLEKLKEIKAMCSTLNDKLIADRRIKELERFIKATMLLQFEFEDTLKECR